MELVANVFLGSAATQLRWCGKYACVYNVSFSE